MADDDFTRELLEMAGETKKDRDSKRNIEKQKQKVSDGLFSDESDKEYCEIVKWNNDLTFNEKDRHDLSMLTEMHRESILAERSEKVPFPLLSLIIN